MGRYRKKPVVIDAVRLPFNVLDMPLWLDGPKGEPFGHPDVIFKRNGNVIIEAQIATLEGTMTASEGDWIIRGVKGELYPCKPDIFDAIYDAVEEGAE